MLAITIGVKLNIRFIAHLTSWFQKDFHIFGVLSRGFSFC